MSCDHCDARREVRQALELPADATEPEVLEGVMAQLAMNDLAMGARFSIEFDRAVRAGLVTDEHRPKWMRVWKWNPAFVQEMWRGEDMSRWFDREE